MNKQKNAASAQFFRKPKFHAAPLVGVGVTLLVLGFFNAQLLSAFVLAYITPASASASNALDLHAPIPTEPRIVIPRIAVDAPVVYGMTSVLDDDVQTALQGGVLHFGGSPMPGKPGNAIFVGHSSNQPWTKGNYKFVFMLLEKLDVGDKIYMYHEGTRYTYQVDVKKVVKPYDVSVLEGSTTPKATFITCTPVGTNTNRLVIGASLIDPVAHASDIEGLTRSAPELNGALPGKGYGTLQSIGQ